MVVLYMYRYTYTNRYTCVPYVIYYLNYTTMCVCVCMCMCVCVCACIPHTMLLYICTSCKRAAGAEAVVKRVRDGTSCKRAAASEIWVNLATHFRIVKARNGICIYISNVVNLLQESTNESLTACQSLRWTFCCWPGERGILIHFHRVKRSPLSLLYSQVWNFQEPLVVIRNCCSNRTVSVRAHVFSPLPFDSPLVSIALSTSVLHR